MANYHTTTEYYFKEQLELSKESLLILGSKLIEIIARLRGEINYLALVTHIRDMDAIFQQIALYLIYVKFDQDSPYCQKCN